MTLLPFLSSRPFIAVSSISRRLCFNILFIDCPDRKAICSLCVIIQRTVATHRHDSGSNCLRCQNSWTFAEISVSDLIFPAVWHTSCQTVVSGFSVQRKLSDGLSLSLSSLVYLSSGSLLLVVHLPVQNPQINQFPCLFNADMNMNEICLWNISYEE